MRFGRRDLSVAGMLMSLMAVSWMTGVAVSLALFTAIAMNSNNHILAGTINLGASPSNALLTASGMVPGSTASGSLLVSNTGTGQLRYAMTSMSTNPDGKGLASELQLVIKTIGTSCAAFDGTTIYSGALASALFGNPAQGYQPGDRTLNAGASETLCFQVTLPSGAPTSFTNATTTTTFVFSAEQTASNP